MEPDTGNVEILLVEDNEDDIELTIRAFRLAKLTNKVHVVRDGAEALEFMFCEGKYAHRSLENVPKIVLLDCKLPKVDGLEVLRRIKSDLRTKVIPVVMLTSSREQKDVIDSYQLGVNAYIVKPVNFEQFADAIQKIGWFWLLLNQAPKVDGR